MHYPQDSPIKVHQSRVTLCPVGFPTDYYWYGLRRHKPGHPPKCIDAVMPEEENSDPTEDSQSDTETVLPVQEEPQCSNNLLAKADSLETRSVTNRGATPCITMYQTTGQMNVMCP